MVDAATIRDAVDELCVILARVDELIVLMEKVNFSEWYVSTKRDNE